MIPKRQLYWNGYNTAVNWGLRDDDVSPIYTPLYHAGGVAAFLIPIFTVGGTIVLHKTFDSSAIWRTIERERCTVVLGVPTTWKMLMDAPEFATADLSRVRWFISGGAPLPHYLIGAYQKRGVDMKQGYGMTEVGVNCFTMTVEESRRKPGSIGKPMMFTEVRIVNDEMWIRGPHVVTFVPTPSGINNAISRVSGNALVWQRGTLTLRLEGDLTEAQALRLARTVRSSGRR